MPAMCLLVEGGIHYRGKTTVSLVSMQHEPYDEEHPDRIAEENIELWCYIATIRLHQQRPQPQ